MFTENILTGRLGKSRQLRRRCRLTKVFETHRASVVAAILVVFVLGLGSAKANLIVNGDFENNSAQGNIFNPSNAEFNSIMSFVTAYGIREGIDIQTFGSPYGEPPQSGSWKVSPAADNTGPTEEFSFDLSSAVTAGVSYDLRFYIERLISRPFDGGRAEIGLSNSSTSFGTLVFTSSLATFGWTQESTTFVAPITANFLTVRVDISGHRWIGLDNFSLERVHSKCSGVSGVAIAVGGIGWRNRIEDGLH